MQTILEETCFHFHPLSIQDCVTDQLNRPEVEEYSPKEDDHFTPYLFMVIRTCGGLQPA